MTTSANRLYPSYSPAAPSTKHPGARVVGSVISIRTSEHQTNNVTVHKIVYK